MPPLTLNGGTYYSCYAYNVVYACTVVFEFCIACYCNCVMVSTDTTADVTYHLRHRLQLQRLIILLTVPVPTRSSVAIWSLFLPRRYPSITDCDCAFCSIAYWRLHYTELGTLQYNDCRLRPIRRHELPLTSSSSSALKPPPLAGRVLSFQ